MFRVIAYDIENDRTRARLARTLEGFGYRVQYSVFEAILTRAEYQKMRQAVLQVVEPDTDAVRYYSLCRTCQQRIELTQTGRITTKPQTVIV